MSTPLYSRLYTDTQEQIYVYIVIELYMVARIPFSNNSKYQYGEGLGLQTL